MDSAQLGCHRKKNPFVRCSVVLSLLILSACIGVKDAAKGPELNFKADDPDRIVVLIDEDRALYRQVITGIHVASGANYRVLKLHEDGFYQSALLEQLVSLKPRALIALGPRAANAVATSRILLPSAFSMVPRIDNYELENVFIAGIRMIPDLKDQISLVRAFLPTIKSLGALYSRSTSRNAMRKLRSLCDDEQIELISIEVQSVNDVMPAIKRYRQEFQALLMIDDPLLLDIDVVSSMIEACREQKIALFSLDCSMVKEGALAAFGTNFYSLGSDLVDIVSDKSNVRVYQPTSFINPSNVEICVNLTTAQTLDAKDTLLHAHQFATEKKSVVRAFR